MATHGHHWRNQWLSQFNSCNRSPPAPAAKPAFLCPASTQQWASTRLSPSATPRRLTAMASGTVAVDLFRSPAATTTSPAAKRCSVTAACSTPWTCSSSRFTRRYRPAAIAGPLLVAALGISLVNLSVFDASRAAAVLPTASLLLGLLASLLAIAFWTGSGLLNESALARR